MPAGPSCPVLQEQVDAGAARIAALATLALGGLVAWWGLGWLALALAADFTLRARGWRAWSPVAILAGGLRRGMRLPDRPINAGPKRFAAALGGGLSLGAGLALLAGHAFLGRGLAAALALCAGLEAFFGVCLACRIHPWLVRATPRSEPRVVGLS